MNYIINYFKVLIIPLGVILISPLLLAMMNLFGLKTHSTLILVIMMILALVSGFMIGRKTTKKGYINGIAFGIFYCLILFIFSLFGKNQYALNTLIYYLIIIISTTVGSMVGIQKQPKK